MDFDDEEFDIPEKNVRFGDNWVPVEHVEAALCFYRNTEKGFCSLACMHSKFRFIEKDHHLRKLREFERKGNNSFSFKNFFLRKSACKSLKPIKSFKSRSKIRFSKASRAWFNSS